MAVVLVAGVDLESTVVNTLIVLGSEVVTTLHRTWDPHDDLSLR